ncbi:hypothetical protein DLAC_11607 [Tieghemostelium lacteum]|uniref:ELMO domain-containing protein n=1 Tax=Tieghemostelium lacteum TaxID=361077 RepID=A0A151ZHW9_TIELA|nr:hypothetical protein DLAC_11607 [Tieghemostelium lacteum]|eukprot:KYQ93582.1 hypothetical protein DLAC_11607 [Tieghemostelium lacteum]
MHYPRFLWKLYKFLIHLFTGKCEIERICYDNELKSKERTKLILLSLENSDKLKEINRIIQSSEFDPQEIAQRIADEKQFNQLSLLFESNILPILISTLEPLSKIQILKNQLKTLYNQAYCNDNATHEEKLEEIWSSLRPGIRRKARLTSEWGDIGFQGKDPSTDFRGMGILGLENLHYLSTQHNEKAQLILTQANTKSVYPFSITGINITSLLVQMLEKNQLCNHFYHSSPTVQQFNELYVKVFVYFNQYYQDKKPVNIMQFGNIMKEFTAVITERLNSPTYDPFTSLQL